MENEPRTDCEQGLHSWSRLHKRMGGGMKAMCNKCGQIAVARGSEWELVPTKKPPWQI